MSKHLKSNERMSRRFGDIVTRSSRNGNLYGFRHKGVKVL